MVAWVVERGELGDVVFPGVEEYHVFLAKLPSISTIIKRNERLNHYK